MSNMLKAIPTPKAPDAKKMKAAPAVQKVANMPDEEQLKREAAIAQAKKQGSGRGSTIMSDYEESLG
jgi:hypothetical protein